MSRHKWIWLIICVLYLVLFPPTDQMINAQNDDGQIIFISQMYGDSGEIITMRPDGSIVANLSQTPNVNETELVCSPDKRQVAFLSDQDGTQNLYIMDIDGNHLRQLTFDDDQDGYKNTVLWIPDTNDIHYGAGVLDGDYDTYTVDTVTGAIEPWAYKPDLDYRAVSPDGKRTARSIRTNPDEPDPYKWKYDLFIEDGTTTTQLTDDDFLDFLPDWSPDGTQIVFESFDRDGSDNDLFIINTDGTGLTNLTNNDVHDGYPCWFDTSTNIIRTGTSLRVSGEQIPTSIIDEQDNLTGFDVELLNTLAQNAGYEIEWHILPYEDLYDNLTSGNLDVLINRLTIIPSRQEIMDFSIPYFNDSLFIMTIAGNNQFITLESFSGHSVGVVAQSSSNYFMQQDNHGSDVVVYESALDVYHALKPGNVDAVLLDIYDIWQLTGNDLNLVDFRIVPVNKYYWGIGVSKDRPDLLAIINDELVTIIEDGTYARLYEEWFGYPPLTTLLPEQTIRGGKAN